MKISVHLKGSKEIIKKTLGRGLGTKLYNKGFSRANGYSFFHGEEDVQNIAKRMAELLYYRKRSQTLFHDGSFMTDNLNNKESYRNVLCFFPFSSTSQSNVIVHGRIFDEEKSFKELLKMCKKPMDEPLEKEIPMGIDGDFSLVFFEDDHLVVIRSPASSKPVFLSTSDRIFALSSDPYPLNVLGLRYDHIPAGSILHVEFKNKVRTSVRRYFSFSPSDRVSENIERVTENVHSSLQYSVEKNLEGKNRVGVAFSGGLDSAILAKLIEEIGVKTSLLTVYAEHSHDSSYAKEVADLFGLEHIAIEVDESVKGRLAMFKELLSTENLMDLSIALILNLVAEKAASCGIEDVVVGQGADELFGGYQKYLNILTGRGGMSVEQVLKEDFDALMSYGVSRDETSIAMFANPLMPFINKKVAESAFSLPTKYKIDSDSSTRKVVLRQLAKKLGLSEKVYSHSKKAMQYSSGVQRLLLRIAKKRNT